MNKCIKCGACDNICPAYAINVQTEFEDKTINGRSK
ncbi:MAG: 4Fe-4S dicluster domain-containing protein [Candidatus Methanofastidiosa archaeon]|nr:4Fe-4S dicluster domain-containing protein [Candidatus Methanofastidiosa archaeon]